MNSIRLCKIEFLRNLNNIENYIIYLEEQNRLFEKMDMNNAFLKDMNMYEIKKRYVEIVNTPVTYNAIIISLYGCYESYVDKLADLLLDHWASTIKSYEDLSAKLKNKHIKKSGEFLTHPRRFRNYELNEKNVIENLYFCLNNEKNFTLNKELLLTHSGNLGIDQLLEFFSDLGLDNCKSKILSNTKYIEFICNKYEMSQDSARNFIDSKNKQADNKLFDELSLLIEQRNKVAHGWCVDNRLSYNSFKDKIIPFMKMLGCVLSDIFDEEFVNVLRQANLLYKFDKPIKVINKRILCINSKTANLKTNGYIYVYNGKKYISLNIIELQQNRTKVEEIRGGNQDIGIEVDVDIKDNWEFFIHK